VNKSDSPVKTGGSPFAPDNYSPPCIGKKGGGEQVGFGYFKKIALDRKVFGRSIEP